MAETQAQDHPQDGDVPIFQCGICQQRYRRADHLARHARIHSHHKPHQCHLCGKAFSRSDLLKRHVASHTGPDGRLKALPRNGSSASRVGQACKACASNHLRCTDAKPCKRCCDKGVECVWDQQRPSSPMDITLTTQDDNQSTTQQDQSMAPMSPDSMPRAAHEAGVAADFVGTSGSRLDTVPIHSGSATESIMPIPSDGQVCQYSGFDSNENLPRLPDWDFLPGQWQLPVDGGADLDPYFPMVGLDEGDIRFLDVYSQFVPFELRTEPSPVATHSSTRPHTDTSPRYLAASGSEAFRKHHWRFRPDAIKDHAGAEESNLSVPQAAADGSSPESRISFSGHITAAPLTISARDAILAVAVKHCRSENLSRIFTSFPSVELLNKLCQYYLTSPIAKADTFIHVPSFNPKEKRPELLLAMVAAGAVLTSDPTLTKFGYAIHELVREAVGDAWERNNAQTRSLELLQAWVIHLEVGLWSGHSRKIEIMESFLQVPMTILRRAGKFKKHEYVVPPLPHNSSEGEIHDAWQSWLQQESYKRLAFRVLRHDTNSSMCLLVNPLLSYAEVTLPLPSSTAQWAAPSARIWARARSRAESATAGSSGQESVVDFMDDPGAFSSHGVQYPRFDFQLASHALLSSAWSLAWECIQMRTLARSKPRRWSSVILSSRQDEVLKLLHSFRISMEDSGVDPEDISLKLRLEHVLLHMHAPVDEIQIFSGMEGPDQAQAMHPIIKEWADGEAARKALCHAGSIVRIVQRMPRGLIQGPLAFIMFHASIVLWTYAVLQSEGTTSTPGRRAQDNVSVWLDDEVDSMGLQRFIQLGAGKPHIRCFGDASDETGSAVSLEDPQSLMDSLVNVLSMSHQGLPVPHLLDKMRSLLTALKASS